MALRVRVRSLATPDPLADHTMGARDSPLPSSHAAPWLSSPRVLSAGARGFATVGHLRSTGLSASILSLSAMRPSSVFRVPCRR